MQIKREPGTAPHCLFASRTTINRFQDTIYTHGIDLTKVVIQSGVIADCARAHEATSKKFSGKSWVETHHFASIVVYTVIIPGRLSTYCWREEHIQWKGKLSRFHGFQNGPVKIGILQASRTTIKW